MANIILNGKRLKVFLQAQEQDEGATTLSHFPRSLALARGQVERWVGTGEGL